MRWTGSWEDPNALTEADNRKVLEFPTSIFKSMDIPQFPIS